ncbi:hypothetical protein HELRODRAFT_173533 [Helobdella robusta]|uniref:OTU domain-containing protein n=1 Tax=Helobdella robusta TaxID=6412 RepID=T1F6Y3_HELRO|nr:hypothetical protein HELRODRAFT_173533 [Helobdella robusta]ESO03254.1 hypothetical protein HELRODRAFT_173533 [Helobdella robusta]
MSKSDSSIESVQQSNTRLQDSFASRRRSFRNLITEITHSADHIKEMKMNIDRKRIKPTRLTNRDIEESILIFNPPSWRWQERKAEELDLTIDRILWRTKSPWHIVTIDTPPKHCEQVAGDGNCLFRSFSFWITGSEDAHLAVRELIIRELASNPRTYLSQTSHTSFESYIRETGMHQEGVWGSEIEIFVAATLLNTPIAVFAAFGDRQLWQVFRPYAKVTGHNNNGVTSRNRNSSLTSSGTNEPTTMLYLHNSSNHFEPVLDV